MVEASKPVTFGESTFSFKMNPKGGTGANVTTRNQGTITEDLYYADNATSTKQDTAEVGVSKNSPFLFIL